jgi:hypothetical protein
VLAFSDPVTIRPSQPDDAAMIARLAALDSAAVPGGPFLLAEVAGELRAACSLADRKTIADPFAPTRHLVALLRQYDAGPTREKRRRGPSWRRRHYRSAPWASVFSPAPPARSTC